LLFDVTICAETREEGDFLLHDELCYRSMCFELLLLLLLLFEEMTGNGKLAWAVSCSTMK
jgi:hypothetical protein